MGAAVEVEGAAQGARKIFSTPGSGAGKGPEVGARDDRAGGRQRFGSNLGSNRGAKIGVKRGKEGSARNRQKNNANL